MSKRLSAILEWSENNKEYIQQKTRKNPEYRKKKQKSESVYKDKILTKMRIGERGSSYKYVDSDGNSYGYCKHCDSYKPLDAEYFFKSNATKSGFRNKCKVCTSKQEAEKYKNDPRYKNKKKESMKSWHANPDNKEKRRDYQRNLQREKMKDPEYREKSNEYHSEYLRNKRANDPAYKLAGNVSRLVRISIQRVNEGLTSKGGKTFEHLPYTPQELVEHLESQFDENMSWDNYGTYWHIDHIIPQAMFPYDSVKHPNFRKIWALDNLQPLEATENISKNSIYKGKKRYYNS